jgi:hypothetical protein
MPLDRERGAYDVQYTHSTDTYEYLLSYDEYYNFRKDRGSLLASWVTAVCYTRSEAHTTYLVQYSMYQVNTQVQIQAVQYIICLARLREDIGQNYISLIFFSLHSSYNV